MSKRRKAPTVIHINQLAIRRNTKQGTCEPPVTFKKKHGGRATVTSGAVIVDNEGKEVARIVYRPHKPLGCGARCWVETQYKVIPEEEFDSCLTASGSGS